MSSGSFLDGLSQPERETVEAAFGRLSAERLRAVLLAAARARLARRAGIAKAAEHLTPERRRAGGIAAARKRWNETASA